MPVKVVPVSLDHQERGIGILKELVEFPGACVKASQKWHGPDLDECVEGWTAP